MYSVIRCFVLAFLWVVGSVSFLGQRNKKTGNAIGVMPAVTTQQKSRGSGSGSIGERVGDNRILPAQGRANRRKMKHAILLRMFLINKDSFMKYRKA